MATAKASEVAQQPPDRGKVMSLLSQVFALNPHGLNWARAVFFLDVALVPYVVLVAIGEQQYFLSAVFAVLFTGVSDPGGSFGYRALRLAVFGLVGAAVTALGFGIATGGWGCTARGGSPTTWTRTASSTSCCTRARRPCTRWATAMPSWTSC